MVDEPPWQVPVPELACARASSGKMELFGIHLIGANAEPGRKLLLTIAFVFAIGLVGFALRGLLGLIGRSANSPRLRFCAT
jgi:hypothetical protein